MGYSTSSPEWLVLNLQALQVRKAYSVRFIESESGFAYRHSKQGLIECEDMPVSIIESELVCDENNTSIVKNIKGNEELGTEIQEDAGTAFVRKWLQGTLVPHRNSPEEQNSSNENPDWKKNNNDDL